MQQFRVPGLGDRLVLAITGAAVALTAGFAGVTFVRLVGLVVLGKPGPGSRPAPATTARRPGRRSCVLGGPAWRIAALTPLEIRVIAAGLAPVVPASAVPGRAEVPVGAAAGVRRLLDLVALLAVARHARAVLPGRRSAPGPVRAPAAAGAPGAALAVGNGRGVRAGQLYRVRLRQPDPPGARRGPAHPDRRAEHRAGPEPAPAGRSRRIDLPSAPHIGYRRT